MSSELPRRAMSSADEVVDVVYMVVERDVVVASAKMEAGSEIKSAGVSAVWTWWYCESEDGGKVGTEGTAEFVGVEPEEHLALSCCCPGVVRGAAISKVDGDGEPVGACGVCDDVEPDAESGGEKTAVAAVCNTKRSLPLATLNRRKQSRTCPRLSIWMRTPLANLVLDVDLAIISIRVLLTRGSTFHLQK
jgi:hypothetical protein